jgi:hypothetical protein
MNKQDIINGIQEIHSARGQVATDATIATWLKYLQKFCIEKKVTPADVQRGIEEYVIAEGQFPNLHDFLDKIRPAIKSKIAIEIRKIDDVIFGRSRYEDLPDEIKKALKTIGGYMDYKIGNSYQRKEWIEKYQDIRGQDDSGYKPIPPTHQVEAPAAEPVLVGKAAEDRIRILKEMLAMKVQKEEEKVQQAADLADRLAP